MATNCGPRHDVVAPAGTKSIDVAAGANIPANDVVLNLYFGATLVAGPADTATSPEAIHYEPAVLTPGTYSAQVCEFNAGDALFAYTGVYATNDVAGSSTAVPYPPKWRFSRPTHPWRRSPGARTTSCPRPTPGSSAAGSRVTWARP
ncbi:MAG: hypothetical protein WKF58_00095 [Ilumatobacteraceae bacterium]